MNRLAYQRRLRGRPLKRETTQPVDTTAKPKEITVGAPQVGQPDKRRKR